MQMFNILRTDLIILSCINIFQNVLKYIEHSNIESVQWALDQFLAYFHQKKSPIFSNLQNIKSQKLSSKSSN